MAERRKKHPRDPLALAKIIGDIATGQSLESSSDSGANESAATKWGRLGGIKGGRNRADKLTPAERQEIARHAANSRWKKNN